MATTPLHRTPPGDTPAEPVPAAMRAAVHERWGGPEVVHVTEVPVPRLRRGDVLVRVDATDVSVADHRLRARDLPRGTGLLAGPVLGVRRPRRHVLGMQVAGEVVAVADDVTAFARGDRVAATTGARFGGHAQYAAVRASAAVYVPDALSSEDAVAVVFGGLTAWKYLARADVHDGSRVLVNGASGAVGTMAVQLAARRGAHVTAVCGARNADLVRDLGATDVVDHRTQDVTVAGGASDVLVDAVGNLPADRWSRLVRRGGATLLVVADLPAMLSAPWHARRHGVRVVTGDLRTTAADLAALLDLVADGGLRPVVDRTYPFDDVVAAHRYVDTGRKRGAVVLRVAP